MKYKIADVTVEFEAKYPATIQRSKKYLTDNNKKSDIYIKVSDEQIANMQKKDPTLTAELSEYMLIGTDFYKEILQFNGCLLHASAIVIDDEAFLFSAPCGGGKSTHTSLWLKYLSDKKPYILNDDKPAIRVFSDGIYAYGTPFSGKHDISENKKVKLKSICFIEQSKKNEIEKLNTLESIQLIFSQTLRKVSKKQMNEFLDVLEEIIKQIPIYKLKCDMSKEAVLLSYNTMRKENKNEA